MASNKYPPLSDKAEEIMAPCCNLGNLFAEPVAIETGFEGNYLPCKD